jgi:S1-C subfamily serine protease
MDDSDRTPTFEPLTPRVTPDAVDPTPTTRVGLPAASSQASDPAIRAGEPTTAAATSSRSATGPGLAGVLATSVLAAVIAAAGTAGLVLTATAPAATPETAAGASPAAPGAASSATPLTISASDAVVAVAEQASPAVVTITTDSAGTGRGVGPFSMPSEGVGSGFVFDADGLILTNVHVVEGDGGRVTGSITVTFQDGSELPATVISTDDTHDLAVIRVDATGLPTIELGDSSALKVGQLTVAIGSPLGTFTETVTSGILSATGRTIEVGSRSSRSSTTMTDLLQTDAAINEGNSGGPLLDSTGHVIGVNVAVAASAQGIGFAVPIDLAADVIAQARAEVGAA